MARRPGALRRQLGLLGTLSLSIGVMAPTLAVSAAGVEPARLLGSAGPLAFVVAALGAGLVAYGFVRLTGAFAHAGSVYAYAARALGPHTGFFTGWAMLGTYLVFPAVAMAAFAQFGQAFLDHSGIADEVAWLPIALIGWALMGLVASRQIRSATSSLLLIELVSVVFVLGLVVLIVANILGGSAPGDHERSFGALFDLPDGADLSTIGVAATVGFLSFAGFEAAGSLGEEANRPTSAIPRSIVVAVAAGGAFYVVCMAVQTLGFGTDADGIVQFSSSEAPLGDLARLYSGSGLATAVDAAAMVSAVGAGLASASVGARMLYALGRDGILGERFAGVSSETGAPVRGLTAVLALDAGLLIGFSVAGTSAQRAFFYLVTIGVLNLLVVYIVTNLAGLRFLAERGAQWELALPVAGIVVAAYVLYHNVHPVPASPLHRLPYVAGTWLALGALALLIVPSLAQRVAAGAGAPDPKTSPG